MSGRLLRSKGVGNAHWHLHHSSTGDRGSGSAAASASETHSPSVCGDRNALSPAAGPVQNATMAESTLKRRLWFEDDSGKVVVGQDFLETATGPLVVLGEAGMGKTTLLGELARANGFAPCTARQLATHPRPAELLAGARTLVVDALDELSARQDGEAVDIVARKLGELGFPRFILSCRTADWRSATSLQGLADAYGEKPIELHMEPLVRNEAAELLGRRVGRPRAEQTLDDLEVRGLEGLWANPQTLSLLGEAAGANLSTISRGALFEAALDAMWREHREEKGGGALATMSRDEVLDAAGAAFAALILTGADAVSRRVNELASDLRLADLAALPGAARLPASLDSRLFASRGPERFSYTHRAIGEFLGARWLARQADTTRKRARMLDLFGGGGMVPASLRGLHAWLAWHSGDLAPEVIATDPLGVVEYGDADRLSTAEARTMLVALSALASEDPWFSDWRPHRMGGVARRELLPELRDLLTRPGVEFRLRLMVLQALAGSEAAKALADTLDELALDGSAYFATRSQAAVRLVEIDPDRDWTALVTDLLDRGSENDVRLAIEVMVEAGYDRFEVATVVRTVLAQLARAEHSIGVLLGVEKRLPDALLDEVLDALAAATPLPVDEESDRLGSALSDLALGLIARRLALGPAEAERVWRWMGPLGSGGHARNRTDRLSEALGADDGLRRALQRIALIDEPGEQNVWQRAWRLSERSLGLALDDGDVVALLDMLPDGDDRWRDLVRQVRHSGTEGLKVRAAAKRLATRSEDAEWLDGLANPPRPDWEIEQERRLEKRDAEKREAWSRHREEFGAHAGEMRRGEYGYVVNPAKAYLKLFQDMGDAATDGPARVSEWLGPELAAAALQGFEAFLTADPPVPTAQEIAESHAEGRRWEAAYVVVSALAERLRTGRGFDDLPDERLAAGAIELTQTSIDDHAGVEGLEEALNGALRQRGAWEATLRTMMEPQLARRQTHVQGLYQLMRGENDAALATRLAADWLAWIPEMAGEAEAEMIDRLVASGDTAALLAILEARRPGLDELSDERRRNWLATGLIADFPAYRDEIERRGVEPEMLWHLRARAGDRSRREARSPLGARLLGWAVASFRIPHPRNERPRSVTIGDTNPWDATDYISVLVNRLGDDPAPAASDELAKLIAMPDDGYTEQIRAAAASQRRKGFEERWRPPDLGTVAATLADAAPTTPSQLRAVVLDALGTVAARIRASDVDWRRDFFRGADPRPEEDCRDTILKMIRPLPFGIQAAPEAHLANDKRSDILFQLGDMAVPLELKGQWHRDVWRAADLQLDKLYSSDWRADGGIYVVIWFGAGSPKPPARPPMGVKPPRTAEEMRDALVHLSATALEGLIDVVVLDLSGG